MLSGPEKAVLLLLSLDEEVALPIVSELGDGELRRLHETARGMRGVPADALDATFRDFVTACKAAVAVPRGGFGYLRRLSESAVGRDRVRNLLEGPVAPVTKLESADPQALAALLANEPPHVAAAVLARMASPIAAEVVSSLSEERQAAVVLAIGRLTEVPSEVVDEVATALAADLPDDRALESLEVDGIAKAAEILNCFGRDASRALLAAIEDGDPKLADQVKQAMFTFDDLVRVGPREMRELLREIPTERLTVALKGASEKVMEAIFAGLSSRAADLIRDDLALLGNVKRSETEAARQEIVQAALRLEGEGKLDLSERTA
jgi:flagellar motor switch protein FliG